MCQKPQSRCWGRSSGWGFYTQTHFFLAGGSCCCREPREVGGVGSAEALGSGWHVHFSLGCSPADLEQWLCPRRKQWRTKVVPLFRIASTQ